VSFLLSSVILVCLIECYLCVLFHINSILGKTVAEHQKGWNTRLVFALSANRATRHRATGHSPNFLVLGREARAPPDIIYGRPETGDEYDPFVERLRDRLVEAYNGIRVQLQWSAGYNKRYYDIGVKRNRFEAGQWVWYFNPRKLQGKQMKWTQQYEGPYIILRMLSSVVAEIQQSSRTKPKVVHVDKLKKFEGVEPRVWSAAEVALAARRDGDREGVTGPYTPSLSANERSRDDVAKSTRAMGEGHFGDSESVDEWMHPSPVLGVIAESADGSTTSPPVFQFERNQLDLSLESTDGKMTPARAELMETSEPNESSRGASPLVDGALNTVEDHLHQTADGSEAANAVAPAERASARAMVYPNFNSVDPTIIIENNNQHFPAMDSDTAEEPGSFERGIQGTTVATGVAGAEQMTRTGHRYNQISSSCVEPEVLAFGETSQKCSHFGEAVIPSATVEPGLTTEIHTCEGGRMRLEGWVTTAHEAQRFSSSEESSARQTSFTKLSADVVLENGDEALMGAVIPHSLSLAKDFSRVQKDSDAMRLKQKKFCKMLGLINRHRR